MAHSQETKSAVRASYVRDRLPLEQVAEKHGISYATVRSWKRKAKEAGDCWEKARVASRMANGTFGDITTELLEDLTLLFQTTITDIKDKDISPLQKVEAISKLSDAYSKTIKAAGGGDQKIAKLAIAMQVLEELAKFIREGYPEQLEVFAAILEPFGQRVSEVFG